eukprot:gene40663-50313_t
MSVVPSVAARFNRHGLIERQAAPPAGAAWVFGMLVADNMPLAKGPSNFELVFHFFAYEDDTPELRELRLLQANLVGPAGYISMEDTEATELVQRGTARDGDKHSYIAMARDAPEQQDTVITENLIRRFWVGYQKLMGY